MDGKPKGVRVQYRVGLNYDPKSLLPWLVCVKDQEGNLLSSARFQAKDEAEQYLDSYAYMLSKLQIDLEYGL